MNGIGQEDSVPEVAGGLMPTGVALEMRPPLEPCEIHLIEAQANWLNGKAHLYTQLGYMVQAFVEPVKLVIGEVCKVGLSELNKHSSK